MYHQSMLTYITHLVDCSWFENKSILTYITHRVFMLQMLQSMLTYLAHNKICGYRFLIVIYLSPNIYTVICVPKLLQIYNLKSHFKHTCWHTWCRISKWACVPKLEQKLLYSPKKYCNIILPALLLAGHKVTNKGEKKPLRCQYQP